MTRDIEDMTDAQDNAPERIWLQEPVGIEHERSWCAEQQSDDDTPYIRADLARPSQAGDERAARLIEAARDVIEGWEWWTVDEYDRDRGAVSDGIHDLRAALATMDTPEGGE